MRKSIIMRRVAGTVLVFIATFVAFDLLYTLLVLNAWGANQFLSMAHISLVHSEPDDELGFIRKPNIVYEFRLNGRVIPYVTDSDGFRNSQGRKSADVVFIGDSFTEAAQVKESETFAGLVERMTGLTGVNLGRGAYGPQQEAIVLRRYGLKYRPKAVVWQLFPGNDLWDSADFEKWRNEPDNKPPLLRRYFSHSMLRTALKAVIQAEPKDRPVVTIRFTGGQQTSAPLRYPFEAHSVHRTTPAFREVFEALERGTRTAREHDVAVAVTAIPTMVHALRDSIQFESQEARERYLPSLGHDFVDFETRIKDFCAVNDCEYLDTLKALRKAAAEDNRDLYIPDDEHLGARGHQVVARTIAEWLTRVVSAAGATD